MSRNGTDLFDTSLLQGDGKTEMVIFDRSGQVIIRFKEPQAWIAFDPSNAVAIAKKIIDVAVECGAQVTLQVPKRKITSMERARLVTRAAHIVRSMLDQGKNPERIAPQIVDTILSSID